MNRNYLIILNLYILFFTIGCDNKRDKTLANKDTLVILKKIPLDTNHFEIINKGSVEELIYINEFGRKEISFEFSKQSLLKVNYFENQKIKRTNDFTNRGKDTLALLKIFYHPNLNHKETFQEGFILKPEKKYVDNVKNPYFEHISFLSDIDTFERNDKAHVIISIPELKDFNQLHLITEGVDDYFRIDTTNFNLINVTNQKQYSIPLDTKSTGTNYQRGIVYYSKSNLDGSSSSTTLPFEFKYYVKSKDNLSNIDKGFSSAIDKKIKNLKY